MSGTSAAFSTKSFASGERNAKFFGKQVDGKFVFDQRKILSAMSKGEARAMSLGGFFVMDTARKSIRDVGKKGLPAKSGSAPKNRTRQLKDFIDFEYDASAHKTIVGPKALNKPAGGGRAPKALEFGGKTRGYLPAGTHLDDAGNPVFNPKLEREMTKNGEGSILRRGMMHEFTIAPHPYMNPALLRNQNKIAKLWKDIA